MGPFSARTFTSITVLMLILLGPGNTANAEPVALVANRIIDGVSSKAIEDSAVIVDGQYITAVVRQADIPQGIERIDLGDRTLMPGMIDAHAHPLMAKENYQATHVNQSSAYKALRAAGFLQQLLLAGWTGTRVAGDGDVFYGDVAIKRTFEEGALLGPRMAVASHYISITGGGGDINYASPEQPLIAEGLIVDSPDEMRKAIRNEVKYGSDWIKILATGAYFSVGDSPKNMSFSPEEFQAAAEEANRQGVPIMAHAHATEGIKQALRAGVRSIEHGTFLDDEVISMLAKSGTWLIPTIYVGDYYAEEGGLLEDERNNYYMEHERPVWIKWLQKAHKKGVKIGVGLDLGGQGFETEAFIGEFATLLEIGMSPMEAIQAGTRVNAELLKWDDKVGSLTKGKLADIIAVDGNPLENITVLAEVNFVMIDGKIVKRDGKAVTQPGLLLQ